MSRSALITGVSGFIGGKLAERLLANGWTVHALVRESSARPDLPLVRFHVYDGEVENLTTILREASPDVVFHLASLYLADHRPDQVDPLIASNILLPTQLAEAMTAAGARHLVNTGTAWQHFGTEAYNPVNLYAATKQACVDILRYYHNARGLSIATLKLFDTYGAGDKRRKLLQLLVDAALSGECLSMSPGEQIVDLIHVDDAVNAFAAAAERLLSAERALNEEYLISGQRLSIRELVALVEAVLGKRVDARFGERPYRVREVMMPVATSPDCELPGWKRRRSLNEAIASLA